MLGVEHVRHRRAAAPEVVVRRLLSLDYLLERQHASWLPTEKKRVEALTAAGVARDVLPRRLYQGAVGGKCRYFPHNLPIALDARRATFVFVQDEDETESAVWTWGSHHANRPEAVARSIGSIRHRRAVREHGRRLAQHLRAYPPIRATGATPTDPALGLGIH